VPDVPRCNEEAGISAEQYETPTEEVDRGVGEAIKQYRLNGVEMEEPEEFEEP